MTDNHDSIDDVRWATYEEIAAARGISKASATRLVFRRGWRRQTGNDGLARVAVPPGGMMPAPDGPPETPSVVASTASLDGSPALLMEVLREQINRGQVQAVELAEARQAQARLQLDLVAMRDLVAAKTADVIAAREALEAAKEFSGELQGRLQLAEATIGRQKRAPGVLARLFRRGDLH